MTCLSVMTDVAKEDLREVAACLARLGELEERNVSEELLIKVLPAWTGKGREEGVSDSKEEEEKLRGRMGEEGG